MDLYSTPVIIMWLSMQHKFKMQSVEPQNAGVACGSVTEMEGSEKFPTCLCQGASICLP